MLLVDGRWFLHPINPHQALWMLPKPLVEHLAAKCKFLGPTYPKAFFYAGRIRETMSSLHLYQFCRRKALIPLDNFTYFESFTVEHMSPAYTGPKALGKPKAIVQRYHSRTIPLRALYDVAVGSLRLLRAAPPGGARIGNWTVLGPAAAQAGAGARQGPGAGPSDIVKFQWQCRPEVSASLYSDSTKCAVSKKIQIVPR